MYRLRLSSRAHKDLDRLQDDAFERVSEALTALRQNPRPHGGTKLRGDEASRIRIGVHRVIYDVDDETRIILVLGVKHQREAYRES